MAAPSSENVGDLENRGRRLPIVPKPVVFRMGAPESRLVSRYVILQPGSYSPLMSTSGRFSPVNISNIATRPQAGRTGGRSCGPFGAGAGLASLLAEAFDGDCDGRLVATVAPLGTSSRPFCATVLKRFFWRRRSTGFLPGWLSCAARGLVSRQPSEREARRRRASLRLDPRRPDAIAQSRLLKDELDAALAAAAAALGGQLRCTISIIANHFHKSITTPSSRAAGDTVITRTRPTHSRLRSVRATRGPGSAATNFIRSSSSQLGITGRGGPEAFGSAGSFRCAVAGPFASQCP